MRCKRAPGSPRGGGPLSGRTQNSNSVFSNPNCRLVSFVQYDRKGFSSSSTLPCFVYCSEHKPNTAYHQCYDGHFEHCIWLGLGTAFIKREIYHRRKRFCGEIHLFRFSVYMLATYMSMYSTNVKYRPYYEHKISMCVCVCVYCVIIVVHNRLILNIHTHIYTHVVLISNETTATIIRNK